MIRDFQVLVNLNMSLAKPYLIDTAAQILTLICLLCDKPSTTQAF